MPDPAARDASHRCAPQGALAHVQPVVLPSDHPVAAGQQRIERYLRLQELGVRECSYEAPLVEEEIALLEDEVLPVIAQFLERADAIAAAREAWAEQQVRAGEHEQDLAPLGLPVVAAGLSAKVNGSRGLLAGPLSPALLFRSPIHQLQALNPSKFPNVVAH